MLISGEGAGGICGQYAGHNEGNVAISDCYTKGDISEYAANAGGICGQYAGANSGNITIYNCYTKGDTY